MERHNAPWWMLRFPRLRPVHRTTVYVAFDQLNLRRGALRDATPQTHDILMVESDRMLRTRVWHAQRLHLLLSAAAHFRAECEAAGYTVNLRQAPTTVAGIEAHRVATGQRVIAAEPSSHAMFESLASAGVEFVANDFFLTSRGEFAAWAQGRRGLLMENFYRWQRTRFGILMDGASPAGGRWNLDDENRLPPPKPGHVYPEYLRHAQDDIDRAVWRDIVERGLPVVGSPPDGTWGTSRSAAIAQLRHFLDHGFAQFGPYEDAMDDTHWAMHHSLLAPYMNLGLLHAGEIVRAAVERYERGGIPLSSAEGFIRQVIGWREYVNGVYWYFGNAYRDENQLRAGRALLPLFDDANATRMRCVGSVVRDVHARGWVHHIPRLMVLSNLALLSGVQPQQYLDWMRRMFVDAADWVMVPNVIGMGVHADGGRMMTKPYVAGGAYISRMSRYCKGCAYDPKQRTGERACPFTTLYWDFLDRHRPEFEGNPRMAQQVRGLDRLSDLPAVRARAAEVLEGLAEGRV